MAKKVTKKDLARVLDWTKDHLQSGNEPPWAWYQYMKLQETLEAILKGFDTSITLEDSLKSQGHQGSGLQLVDGKFQPNTVQRRSGKLEVTLPM